jgi:hypothetical protein
MGNGSFMDVNGREWAACGRGLYLEALSCKEKAGRTGLSTSNVRYKIMFFASGTDSSVPLFRIFLFLRALVNGNYP